MAIESMTIPSRVDCIDDVRRWVSERIRRLGLGDDPIADVELALTEALANVIEHGYGGYGGGEIRVGVEGREGAVAVSVQDWGRGFDPEEYAPRDLDDPGEGGYGVYLIEQLMDDVIREAPSQGGNLLTLIKRKDAHHG